MFYDLLGGVTKLEAFQCYFVTKLNPLKPSPILKVVVVEVVRIFLKVKTMISKSNML